MGGGGGGGGGGRGEPHAYSVLSMSDIKGGVGSKKKVRGHTD